MKAHDRVDGMGGEVIRRIIKMVLSCTCLSPPTCLYAFLPAFARVASALRCTCLFWRYYARWVRRIRYRSCWRGTSLHRTTALLS